MKRWWYFALLVVALSAVSAAAETASQVFKQVSPSVVVILTYDADGNAVELGSGVKLPDGAVATNCHVLKDGTTYKVRYRNKTFPAILAKSDWNRDVCTLTVPNLPAPSVVLGSTKNLQTGATVFAIGTPEGLQLTLSEGIVSSLRPVGNGSYIQTTAAISPGSSGGGLFDDQGRLLGLTSFYVSNGQQLNFALPVEWIKALPHLSTQRAAQGASEVDWINRAAALKAKNDWKGLLALAKRWTTASPKSAVAWDALGEAYYEVNMLTSAIDSYRHAIQINPLYAVAWTSLGVAYSKMYQNTRAIDAFREALRINPQDEAAWYNLGIAYENSGQHTQSIDAFHQALRIKPQDEAAWYNLGVTYAKSHQNTLAIDAYRQALRINAQDEAAWYNLGIVYDDSDQYTQAIGAYSQALRIDSRDTQAWTNLGVAYGKFSQNTRAIDAFRQALRINPRETQAWAGLCVSYALAGQRDQAVAAYQHLKTLSPNLANELLAAITAQFHAHKKADSAVRQKRVSLLRPVSATDIKAWQTYLIRVSQANMEGITNSHAYLYFVPASDTPGAAASIARVQHNLDEVVAATVLPNNMIGIGGPSSSTTATVLETAFSNATPGSFKGVVILFMGAKTDEAAVGNAVAPSGATFRFADIVGGH